MYNVELENRTKSDKEGWADYEDTLSQLVSKAFPDLQVEAREQIALSRYLNQLHNPQIAVAVRQRCPKSIQEAVTATLELESYLVKPSNPSSMHEVAVQEQREGGCTGVAMQLSMLEKLQKLLSRVKQLESELERNHIPPKNSKKAKPVVCRICGQVGHYARGCVVKQKPSLITEQETVDSTPTQSMQTLSINNVSSYTLTCKVYGTPVSFLIDTGAGVCLLKDEVWNKVKPEGSILKPLKVHGLVGVDGIPIKVQGSATINLSIAGKTFNHDFIIANQITTDAILGLDFLESHNCILNMAEGMLSINGHAVVLNPHKSPTLTAAGCVKVTVVKTITIPASSEMEIAAHVNSTVKSVWLVEGDKSNLQSVCVARALVTNHNEIVPLRVVNTNLTPVTLHEDSRVALAEGLNETAICNTTVSDQVKSGDVHDIELAEPLPDDITNAEREQFLAFLSYYSDVVAANSDDLGRTNVLQHHINTGVSPPIHQSTRRVPLPQRDTVHQLLQEMLKRNVISPSKSPWASPIVLVKKKDGTIRFCVDYRKVNNVTTKDAYPPPRVDDTLDTLAGSVWFTILDLKSGYCRLRSHPKIVQRQRFAPKRVFMNSMLCPLDYQMPQPLFSV